MARESEFFLAQRRALGSRLAVFRRALDLTQQDLASALHYERSSITHIESGRQTAPRRFWEHADTTLNAEGALLADFDALDRLRAENAAAGAELERRDFEAKARQLRARESELLPDRGGGAGAVLDAVVWSWQHPAPVSGAVVQAGPDVLAWLMDSERSGLKGRTTGWRRLGLSDVERVRRVRHRLKDMDSALGGGAVLPMALAYLRQELPPLLSSQFDERTAVAIVGSLAELTLDIGWMAYDAGIQAEARRQMIQALHLAELANDRLFGGRVIAAMSHQALHLGRVGEAIDLAQAATAGAKRVASPRAIAMFSAMEACAFAAGGQQQKCFQALNIAERAIEKPFDERPTWLDFDDGGFAGHAARALCALGRPNDALRYTTYAIEHCLPDHARTRAQRLAIHARALCQVRDLERAAAAGEQVIDDAWRLHSGLVRHDVSQLAKVLEDGRSATVLRFVARAQELSRLPLHYSFSTT